MKKLAILVAAAGILVACQEKNAQKNIATTNTEAPATAPQTLIGKSAVLTYPNLTAEVKYLSEKEIHWKTTDDKGNVAEQTNELTYKPISENQFFLNWVENDGTTVSQVIDTEKQTVSAYLTYSDENGKRIAQLLEGKIELK